MQNEELVGRPSKWSIGLKWGVAGSVAEVFVNVMKIVLGQNPYADKFDWSSVLIAIIVFGTIVMAHKEYKKGGDGFMTFGEGLGIGCIAGLIGLVVVISFKIIYVKYVDQTLYTAAFDAAMAEMESENTPEQVMDMMKKYFSTIFYGALILVTLFRNFIFALLVSAFTQKANPNPDF